MRKRTRIILIALGGYTLLSLIVGCRTPLQPIPGPGRDGRLYCYTVDYHDKYLPFSLIGKSLTCGGGDGSWTILPPPTAIFPGLPLYLIEQFAICPAIGLNSISVPPHFLATRFAVFTSLVRHASYLLWLQLGPFVSPSHPTR